MADDLDDDRGGPERKSRKASKETRRQQLIEATIDSLAKRGYSDTTLANVADGAGLSRGIVNFHFDSKENLLIATLQSLADEYAAHWQAVLEKTPPDAAHQLWALVAADFDRKICTKRKLAAWYSFWGEAKSRPTYQAICGARDIKYQDTYVALCERLREEGRYATPADTSAMGLSAMMEGLWLRLMLSDGINRTKAHETCIAFLVAAFPRHFSNDGVIWDGAPLPA